MINSGGRLNYNIIVLGGSAPEQCAAALAEGGLDWMNMAVFISVAGP